MPRLRYTANYGKTLLVRINVHSPEITIGRGRENTIWLDHPTVSRYHAKISFFRGKCTIYDRDSMNGIEIEGREMIRASSIKPGDKVRCGECELEILPDPKVDLNEGLARLRELLHQEPSNRVWEALTDMVVQWPDTPELELALDYVTGHLQEQPHWTEFVRYAPPFWQVTLKNVIQRLPDLEEKDHDRFIHKQMRAFVLGPTDPRWRLIQKLDFSHEKPGAAGIRFFGKFPMLADLTALDLGDNGLGDDGLRALLSSPHLKHLRELHLWSNHIGDEGAQSLAEADQLQNVSVLNLGNNNIGPLGADALKASPSLPHVDDLNLNLSGNPAATQGRAFGYAHVSMSPGSRMDPSNNLPRPISDEILRSANMWPLPDEILTQCRALGLMFLIILLRGERAEAVAGMREGDELDVGRGEDNHWRLRQAELDRKHARLQVLVPAHGNPMMVFEDLDTSIGTYVRGQRAQSGRLQDYEFIEIGAGWRLVSVSCAS